MTDEVRQLLRAFQSGCSWTCGTCGGHAGRVLRLREAYRRNRTAYLEELAGLRAADFVYVGDAAPLARAAVDSISNVIARKSVLDRWAQTVDHDPEIAIVVLLLAGPHLHLSARLVRTMLDLSKHRSILARHLAAALGPAGLVEPHLRDDATAALRAEMTGLSDWEELQTREDERRAMESARRAQEREEQQRQRVKEVTRICGLPLVERLKLIAEGTRRFSGVEPELARATEEEVESLTPKVALEIARLITPAADAIWIALKERLLAVYEGAQQQRQARITSTRTDEISRIGLLPQRQRLEHVARAARRTLAYWPSEWTDVDDDVIAGLDPNVRTDLASKIRRQSRRLRPAHERKLWRALAQRLEARGLAGDA